jgi:hypothetical protein
LKTLYRRAPALAAPVAMTFAALLAQAAPAAASTGWQLTDQYTARPACFTTSGGTVGLEVDLNGGWSTSISVGAANLPSGFTSSGSLLITFTNEIVSSETSGAPIPPGSSNGTGPIAVSTPNTFVEGYVMVTAPGGLATGSSFDLTISANDGSTTQTETVPVVIKTGSCTKY